MWNKHHLRAHFKEHTLSFSCWDFDFQFIVCLSKWHCATGHRSVVKSNPCLKYSQTSFSTRFCRDAICASSSLTTTTKTKHYLLVRLLVGDNAFVKLIQMDFIWAPRTVFNVTLEAKYK